MKKLLNLVLLAVIFNSLGSAVRGQENGTCFMLDSNGNPMNLGNLCQTSSPPKNNLPKNNFPRAQQPTNSSYRDRFPQSSQNTAGVYVIPIKSRIAGVPVVDVTFNSQYTFEMLLDTGASGIYLTPAMARKLDVHYTQTEWISTASDRIAVPTGRVYSVEVGDIVKNNPQVSTLSSMDIGLLGQSFFGGYDMTIKSDTIEFRER